MTEVRKDYKIKKELLKRLFQTEYDTYTNGLSRDCIDFLDSFNSDTLDVEVLEHIINTYHTYYVSYDIYS